MKPSLGRRFGVATGVISAAVTFGVLWFVDAGLDVPRIAGVITVAALVGGIAGRIAVWPVLRSMHRLVQTTRSLAAGDVSARARLSSVDALTELGRRVDELADRLEERGATSEVEGERYGTVFDAMAEAVLVVDRRDRVVLTNTQLNELVGGVTVGRSATEVIRHPTLHAAIARAQQGEDQRVEFELPVADGARQLQAHVSPLARGGGVVAVLHDVTSERMAERIRRDFVANASHELRTPLTAIRGFAETLQTARPSDPEGQARFAGLILKHTKRLQALVEDLSALSRAESGVEELALEEIDLRRALGETLDALSSGIEEKGLSVETSGTDQALPVRADARALDQVLLNLVDNAVKYTPEGGAITIRARFAGRWIELDIGNTGPGIPISKLPRVFERFYRVDPGRSREVGGTGLGLAIVKHQVARLGGEVRAESEPGSWTRFRLRLPVA